MVEILSFSRMLATLLRALRLSEKDDSADDPTVSYLCLIQLIY